MRRLTKLFLASILACSTVCAVAQGGSLVGTWTLDVGKSDFGGDPAPKSLAFNVLKDSPQLFSWRAHGVDGEGKPIAFSWSGPPDGSMHALKDPSGKTLNLQSVKRQGATLLRHGEESAQGLSFDASAQVSEDGKTFTDIITATVNGKSTKQTNVFHRSAGTHSTHKQQ